MTYTREEMEKAIKHYKCECDGAIVVLDSGFGNNPGENNLLYRNRKERAQIAIDAIEKQLPQKPIGTYTDYKCPVCSRRVRSGKGSSSHGQRDNFCQRCGQKLDWED